MSADSRDARTLPPDALTLPPASDQDPGQEPCPWTLFVAVCPGRLDYDSMIVLEEGELRIGRERDPRAWPARCLVLPDPAVSRRHGLVRLAGDTLTLVDSNSSYGSYLNGRRVTEAVLAPGDVVRLGHTVLVVGHGLPAPHEDAEGLGMVGRAPGVHELRTTIRRVAPSELVVLAIGPTGTGKELVARAVHAASGRAGAFVAINCAALPAALVENLLFGHRKGAYTGASSDEDGAFVRAQDGTLFLDEVGELPLESQPKLLRALENHEVTPLGATQSITVNARIVVATNVDLQAAVRAGRFREDLYARVAGVILRPPALVERREDIVPLFTRFLATRELGERRMSAEFVETLLRHAWPRNVRELVKLAERLAVLHPQAKRWERSMLDGEFQAEAVSAAAPSAPETPPGGTAAPPARTPPVEDDAPVKPPSRDHLVALLEQCDGNVSRVARMMGRNRKQVYRWMDQYSLGRGTGR
ncbi:MAG TPA: sigma 54-interacting transcriptional regulator [Polyangia bacterium]|nr:sigma 54-interacting transcriptional regulator [Polyangia bacterium]